MDTTTLFFCDMNGETIPLAGTVCPMDRPEFQAKFPGVKGIKYDGYSFCVMARAGGGSCRMADMLPVTRAIRYKRRPSLHECNARCQGGKCNGVCECRCGGRNHGINSVL